MKPPSFPTCLRGARTASPGQLKQQALATTQVSSDPRHSWQQEHGYSHLSSFSCASRLFPRFQAPPPPRQRNPFHFVLADSSVHDDPRIAITCHEPLPDLDQFSRYPLRPCVGSCTQKPVIVALTLAATLTVSVSESLIFMSTPPPPPPPPPPQPPTRPAAGAAAAAVAAAAVAPSATPATAKSVLPDL